MRPTLWSLKMSFNSRQAVSDWNIKCANLPAEIYTDEYWVNLQNQAKCLQEEVDELVAAIKARDRYETVDAQADIQVVLDGLIFMSQHDHDGAMQAVCDNNDHKYRTNPVDASYLASEIYDAKGEDVQVLTSELNGKKYYSVHRVSDNKIMKSPNHPKVDLSKFVAGAEQSIMVLSKPNCPLCDALILNLSKTLGIKNLEILEPYSSPADADFVIGNGLTLGDVVFYNGTTLKKTNYGTEQFDIRRVERWLKSVGAL